MAQEIKLVNPTFVQHGDFLHFASEPCYQCGTMKIEPSVAETLLEEARGLLNQAQTLAQNCGRKTLRDAIGDFLKRSHELVELAKSKLADDSGKGV